jgi:ribosome-binding ATPase YchF (GTP1/OBG family)
MRPLQRDCHFPPFVAAITRVFYSLQVEAELNELDKEEAAEYLASLGVEEGGLGSLIKATYRQLGLLTYFTTGGWPASCIACWTIHCLPMPQADL